ncbi:MAG: hypothetical protein PHD67_08500 [Oscillospiraceae bacterium]|nr:hypothetical protein [Oscillospiraceae bacterium]
MVEYRWNISSQELESRIYSGQKTITSSWNSTPAGSGIEKWLDRSR